MEKFLKRMSGILPEGEIPLFVSAIETLQNKPRKSLRLNRLAKGWTKERLEKEGIRFTGDVAWCKDGYFYEAESLEKPATHPLVAAGIFFIQEAGAMEPVEHLDVKPGQLVLDLCGAPGAKSTQIGERLNGEGWLVSNDPHRDRSKTLSALLSRHGISNSTVHNLEPKDLAKIYPATFDRILVDAPCSGESLFAKRKEKRFDVSDNEVERCALRQSNILKHAAEMLAPGGRIVYSTCTYSRGENEDVVEKFLSETPGFTRVSESRRMPHRDGVAGGYFAVLESSADGERGAFEQNPPEAGLVRNGDRKWDGSADEFTILMDRFERERDWPTIEWSKADLPMVRKYLAGDLAIFRNRSDLPEVPHALLFEGECIGGIRREGGRFRNLSPRALNQY